MRQLAEKNDPLFGVPDFCKGLTISIDPGFKYTGVTLIANGEIIICCSLVNSDRKISSQPITMAIFIIEFIDKNMVHNPSLNCFNSNTRVIYESYGYGTDFFAVGVAELVGILKYKFSLLKWNMYFLAPNSVKKIVTGNGRATKSDVANVLKDIYKDLKISVIGDDNPSKSILNHAYDSLAVFYSFDHISRSGENLTNGFIRRCVVYE